MAEKEVTEQVMLTKDGIPRKDADWLDLCAWVEREIFQYDANMHIGKKASLVLSGLRHGQVVTNNSLDKYGDYPLKVIKMAFIMNKTALLKALQGKEFDGEEKQMRYVCAILRDKIPNVYLRWVASQKSQTKIETMSTESLEHQGAEYTQKTEVTEKVSKLDKKFEELW
jgi:hypothetical protein